jgi:pseudaminic acid synthase
MKEITIAGRQIGSKYPPYIIGEMSGNHNGDIGRALVLLNVAKKAGVDAVKLQTYTPDTITLNCDLPDFRIKSGPWKDQNLYELYSQAHTPWAWHPQLFSRAKELGLTIFSSPFDETAVDFLESLAAPAYKVASFELLDLPLIKRVACTRKPLIMSTGMASVDEIAEAVETALVSGTSEIVLLHCISGYPTPVKEANLKTIHDLASRFGVIVGLSDHSEGVAVPIAAVALGASVIEKHFTLARADGGPDSGFSLEPSELRLLVSGCRSAWDALGTVNYQRSPSELENMHLRRSIYVVEDISAGEMFTRANIRSIRPGFGLPPKDLPLVLGRIAKCDLVRGSALKREYILDFSD